MSIEAMKVSADKKCATEAERLNQSVETGSSGCEMKETEILGGEREGSGSGGKEEDDVISVKERLDFSF